MKHLVSLTENKQKFSCQILKEYGEGSLKITYSNIACPVLQQARIFELIV